MMHEKIFERGDGFKWKVVITLMPHRLIPEDTALHWQAVVFGQEAGSDKWESLHINAISKDKFKETQLELWEKLKP